MYRFPRTERPKLGSDSFRFFLVMSFSHGMHLLHGDCAVDILVFLKTGQYAYFGGLSIPLRRSERQSILPAFAVFFSSVV